jgi:hypothetical protein
MERFLSRESEKNEIVREHRDLLFNLHEYIAWLLHTSAESPEGRGSIEEARLREEMERYLEKEGYETGLAWISQTLLASVR